MKKVLLLSGVLALVLCSATNARAEFFDEDDDGLDISCETLQAESREFLAEGTRLANHYGGWEPYIQRGLRSLWAAQQQNCAWSRFEPMVDRTIVYTADGGQRWAFASSSLVNPRPNQPGIYIPGPYIDSYERGWGFNTGGGGGGNCLFLVIFMDSNGNGTREPGEMVISRTQISGGCT